jgi:DNA polymerase (family X)
MATNEVVARRFEEISEMIDLLGEDSFRASAHARAARSVADLPFDVSDCDRSKLLAVEGIGPKIADKIIEYCTTGDMREHAELREKVPAGLLEVLKIPGLGPKSVRALWQSLGVTDVAGLKRVIDDGTILTVPRMGQKLVERLKAAIAVAEEGQHRLWLGKALPLAEIIVERMLAVPGVVRAAYAGSLRRGRDSVGDLDILVAASDPAAVSEAFRSMECVQSVIAAGETKTSVRISVEAGLGRWKETRRAGEPPAGPLVQTDLRVVPESSWGAALVYFTGSKDHNVRLRELAQRQGFTLNEYGLFPEDDEKTPPQSRGIVPLAGRTEEEVYAALNLPFFPPEMRENKGEISLKESPRLIDQTDIKAELHAHTIASDGGMSIEELAERARARGYHTIAVTDHSKSSTVAGGLTIDRLLAHIEAVREADEKMKDIRVLAGSEVDILADGSLDYPDDILQQLDIVVASPHAGLTQDPEVATKRLLRAIGNPFVHIIGHMTGRLINRRGGMSPDVPKLAAAAKAHNVALEINAHWMRLDLRDVHARMAIEAGCLIAINCDVHAEDEFENIRYGVLTARRAWMAPEMCINTWPAQKLHDWLSSKRSGRR